MAWVLVKWLKHTSRLPSSWVLKPTPLPEGGFPIDATCFWRKKTSTWETVILAVSGKFFNTLNLSNIIDHSQLLVGSVHKILECKACSIFFYLNGEFKLVQILFASTADSKADLEKSISKFLIDDVAPKRKTVP